MKRNLAPTASLLTPDKKSFLETWKYFNLIFINLFAVLRLVVVVLNSGVLSFR
jgi:hypothetical protein